MQPVQPTRPPQPIPAPQPMPPYVYQPRPALPRTPAQRQQEWRMILLISVATLAVVVVLAQCILDVGIIGRLSTLSGCNSTPNACIQQP